MTNQTRKYIWPVSLAMSLALVGVLVAFVAMAGPQTAQAHGPCNFDDGLEAFVDCVATGGDDEHTHDGSTPEPNKLPVVVPGILSDVSLRINMTLGPIDLSDAFTDADGDTLTYGVMSDNRDVADATVQNGMMTIVAGNIRGTARITVTANDGKSGMAETSFEVEVAEDYTLTADPMADMMQLMELQDSLPAGDPLRMMLDRIPHGAIYVVESENADYSALFHLAVAGSDDDVTVTITAREPAAGGITIVDSDGLIGAGFKDAEETDLEGSLTVKATDDGSRAFAIEGMCRSVGAFAIIMVDDKDLKEVAEGAILCERAPVILPEDRDDVSDQFTVTSYGDWEYEDVTDGFILDVSDGNMHMVNDHHNETGLLRRDEPVLHDMYTLGVSEREMLASLPGGAPRRAKEDANLTRHERNADVEEGQRTIEVLAGQPHVQLTVTSRVEGPAYIRFLDSNMQPFGTDVDEEAAERGADVVGLDSQGRLELNLMPELSAAKALAYDQYVITTPGDPTLNSYLAGLADDYYQGMFRFFDPCPAVGHHFYVEVYESEGKYLQTTEKVVCVPSPKPGPAGLVFEIDSQKPGEGVLSFEPARNAVSHTVLLIDASNRSIVKEVEDAVSPVMFNEEVNVKLNNGWTYHIVVIAEGVNDQYTADAVLDYGVSWLDEADVPLSTDLSVDPTRMHTLCQVDDADITALLADCDADPVNAAPMAVGTIAAVTVTAGEMSDAMDVSGYFSDADMDTLTYTASSDMEMYATAMVNGSMLTITGVAAGMATITVTATDMAGEMATQDIMVTVEAVDTTPMAPTVIMATVDDSDPGSTSVTVTWTDGANVPAHGVVLFSNNFTEWNYIGKGTGGSHTFTNVASGSYIAVVVSLDAQGGLMTEAQGNYLYAGATVVTVQ